MLVRRCAQKAQTNTSDAHSFKFRADLWHRPDVRILRIVLSFFGSSRTGS